MKLLSALSLVLLLTGCVSDSRMPRATGPWDRSLLRGAPVVTPGARIGRVEEIYHEGMPRDGKPTQVFAYLGRPADASGKKLPVVSRGQTKKFTSTCGAALPSPFVARLDKLGDDDAAVTQFGIDDCGKQCEELIREGVPGIHFYTLNKAHSTVQVVRAPGLA